MAAAEARAVWQRTANRFFIQEDAKRAPKLHYCPSNSSLLSKQVDTKPSNSIDMNESFPLPDDKYSYSNFSSESKWWLQSQPDYIFQRGLTLTNEQVNVQNPHQFVENQDGSSVSSMSKESYEFVEMDWVDCCNGFNEANEFKLDSKFHQKIEIEKNGEIPWWQMAEKDDFASFFSKKSQDFIENCDISWAINSSSKLQQIKCQNTISRVEVNHVTSKPISSISMASSESTIHQGQREKPIPEVDSSKSKILEALCHSQTRARKAEIAAKEAYAEKDHVIKLLFKQASQLFAYRQWIYLLQLENLYYQIKNNKSTQTSPILPPKSGILHKNVKKPPLSKGKKRGRHGVHRYEHDIGKYAVVFVVGLGLVGAGLLLGWTVGWMLI